ncbi:MAG: tetratricopeptide repeat protein [Bacteroidota bacterium]
MVYNQQSHAVENFLRAFSSSTGTARQCAFVQQWPLLHQGTAAAQDAKRFKASGIVCNLLAALQKCVQKEALKPYKGFFKVVKKALQYHNKPYCITKRASTDKTHAYTYQTQPFDASWLHIRHVPKTARQFLIGLQRGAPAHLKIAEQHPAVHDIQSHRQRDFISITASHDIRPVVDQLIRLGNQYTTLHITCKASMHYPLSVYGLTVPPVTPFFVGRNDSIKKLLKVFESEAPLVIAPPITGPGGLGKTQLAVKVLAQQTAKKQYDHVFWIPAETPQKLQDTHVRMAEHLGLYVDKENLSKVVQDVRVYLQDKRCLYVFDSAPCEEALEEFLPLYRGHVLITSRNSATWSVAPMLLAPLDVEEAVELAQHYHCVKSGAEKSAMTSLLALVPKHPLSLAQLFNILADEAIGPKAFIKVLKNYEVNAQEQALLAVFAQDLDPRIYYDNGLSLLYIFKKTLKRLAKEEKGAEAIQLLSQLSCLGARKIPLDFIFTLCKQDDSSLHSHTRAVLLLLEKYCLVQWVRESQGIYMHAETQRIVRHLYPQRSLTGLINYLLDYVGNEDQAEQNFPRWVALLPHGERIFKRLDTTQYPKEAYRLANYLSKACAVDCLFHKAVSWSQRQLSIAQQRYSGQAHPDVAEALDSVGWSLKKFGKYEEALVYLKDALAMRQRVYKDQDHPHIAASLNNIGWCLDDMGGIQKSLEYQKKSLAMLQRLYKKQARPDVAKSLYSVGWCFSELGYYLKAVKYTKWALAMYQQIYKHQDHTDLAESLHTVGVSLGWLGSHVEEALAYHQQALEMQKRLYSNQDHPSIADSLHGIAWRLWELGNYPEALEYAERALEMLQRLYRHNDSPYIPWYISSVGDVLADSGNHSKALVYYKEAFNMRKRLSGGKDHPYAAWYLNKIGWSLGQLGDYSKALKYLRDALAMLNRVYENQDHPYTAFVLNRMSGTLAKFGIYQEALAYNQKALLMQKRLYNDLDHPWLANTLNSAGVILQGLEKPKEALRYYQQAACMALRIYKRANLSTTEYFDNLTNTLSKTQDKKLIQKIKAEVVPLCTQILGKNHDLVKSLEKLNTD